MPRDISLDVGARESFLRESLYRTLADLAETAGADRRVLDIGSGRGELLQALSGRGLNVLGADAERACVDAGTRFGEVLHAGIAELPERLHGERFGAVVCSHVLEHLRDPCAALELIGAISADRYILAVPNLLRPARIVRALVGSDRGDHPHHLHGWGRAEFGRLLAECGFRTIEWRQERVTVIPFGGRAGTFLGRCLRPLEERLLVRLFPMLGSSLIAVCERDEASAGSLA